jgi:hypothetical protein
MCTTFSGRSHPTTLSRLPSTGNQLTRPLEQHCEHLQSLRELEKEAVFYGNSCGVRRLLDPVRIVQNGLAYMLRGDEGASNTDPYATKATADKQWVVTPAHVI